jgi:hypothetical protein
VISVSSGYRLCFQRVAAEIGGPRVRTDNDNDNDSVNDVDNDIENDVDIDGRYDIDSDSGYGIDIDSDGRTGTGTERCVPLKIEPGENVTYAVRTRTGAAVRRRFTARPPVRRG